MKTYVVVDVETSGPTPGKYSMLALGACLIDDIDENFYRELKPISANYTFDAMQIASLGLRCLDDLKQQSEYNAKSNSFKPELVLAVLLEKGYDPSDVMSEFNDWVLSMSGGYEPILASNAIVFDGMFVHWYFNNFYSEKNPFGHKGEDIGSMFRGYKRDIYAKLNSLKLENDVHHTHNALDDAIEQAKRFKHLLEIMKK